MAAEAEEGRPRLWLQIRQKWKENGCGFRSVVSDLEERKWLWLQIYGLRLGGEEWRGNVKYWLYKFDVKEHLICDGIVLGYVHWIWHGEGGSLDTSSSTPNVVPTNVQIENPEVNIIHDAFAHILHGINEPSTSQQTLLGDEVLPRDDSEDSNKIFYELLKDGNQELEKIRNEMDQDSYSQSQSISQDDPLGKAFGKEHPGRVRGLGFGPCPSKVFNNTSSSSNDNQMKEYVSNLEKEIAATKAQLQVQNDMQKAMGGALVAIWKKLLAKFLNNLLPCLTKHLNQYPMKEASTNLHKGVESNIHPLVIMLMDNLLHDYYNIFPWRQL
nr:uncharacterized protein LOC109155020 isoform X1 [Ipomoea batatas]